MTAGPWVPEVTGRDIEIAEMMRDREARRIADKVLAGITPSPWDVEDYAASRATVERWQQYYLERLHAAVSWAQARNREKAIAA